MKNVFKQPEFILKLIISLSAIVFIIIKLIRPDLEVDVITLGLLIVAILPWLSSLIKSAEFPGGWKIEFKDVKEAVEKAISEKDRSLGSIDNDSSIESIAKKDPNLALVSLRIEIEKRLRSLAEASGLPRNAPLTHISQGLSEAKILTESTSSGLCDLVTLGNRAAHGVPVDADAANWAISYGPRILSILDEKKGKLEISSNST
jgi:hypothetical protein